MAETARVLPLARTGEGAPHATLLGAFRLTGPGGANLTPRAKKTRALLAYLLLAPGPVPRDRLAALLWGDRGEEQAKASLRQALYELRALAAGPEPLLSVERDLVSARPGVCDLDSEQLLALARAGEAGALAAAIEAADLDLLADLYGADREFDEWLRAEQVHTRGRLLAAAVAAGETALAGGRISEARQLADALGRADPLHEPAVRLGLAGDRAAGDLAALHARYRRFAERLKRDLGAEPAPETQALLKPQAAAAPADVEAAATVLPAPGPASLGGRRPPWLWMAAGLLVAVLAFAAVWGWSQYAAPAGARTLAVASFAGAGPLDGPQGVRFGPGVSEAVRELLGRTADLKLVGGASSDALAARQDRIAAARRLGVDYVLGGSARSANGRLSVTADLTRVRDGKVVWRGAYQRPVDDIFAVQNEIAAAVSDKLGARLSPRNNPHLVTRPEVYDRYLEARSLARERRLAPLLESQRLLLEAAALDPDFAPAFASLSQVTILLADHPTSYGEIPIVQAQAEARRYARRALQLAPELGEAYAAYGLISLSDGQSLPFYARAVALDPQRPEFHRWLAQSLSAVGREDAALAEYQRAAALDPLNWLTQDHLVGQLMFLGRTEEAAAAFERFARISNDAHGVTRVRAEVLSHQGRLADYLRLTHDAMRQWPQERTVVLDYAEGWAILGEPERALAALPPREVVGRLALSGDNEGLAREARRLGAAFWDSEPGYWNFAERLVLGGHGAVLLKAYDDSFESVDDFYARVPSKALSVGPALIAALTDAGRGAEAQALARRILARLDSDVKAGMDPGHAAYDRASILALSGQRDPALTQLALAVRSDWANAAWAPSRLSARLPFRTLAGDPRLAPIQAELDARVNRERALLGLPPIRN